MMGYWVNRRKEGRGSRDRRNKRKATWELSDWEWRENENRLKERGEIKLWCISTHCQDPLLQKGNTLAHKATITCRLESQEPACSSLHYTPNRTFSTVKIKKYAHIWTVYVGMPLTDIFFLNQNPQAKCILNQGTHAYLNKEMIILKSIFNTLYYLWNPWHASRAAPMTPAANCVPATKCRVSLTHTLKIK